MSNNNNVMNSHAQISIDEFNALRNETVERISIMNSQASNAIGMILTTWAAGFGLLGINFTNLDKLNKTTQIVMSFGQISAFFFSIFLLIPMAIKSGENLRQLVSIGVYTQVFFNYISQNKTQDIDHTIYVWETADKSMNTVITGKGKYRVRDRLFNSEYVILSIISLFFLIGTIIFNYSVLNINSKLLITIYGLIITIAIFLILSINSISSAKHNLSEASNIYTKKYLSLAVDMGLIAQTELQKAWEQLNPNRVISDKYNEYFNT